MGSDDGKKPFDDSKFESNELETMFTELSSKEPSPAAPNPPKTESQGEEYKHISPGSASKSHLSLVSGLGFVIIAVILYFFLTKYADTTAYIVTFLTLLFSSLIAFFYLLNDLTISPARMTSRGAHFISGMILGALALLTIMVLNLYPEDWLFISVLFMLAIFMNACVALFLYSLMWEE